MKKETDKELKLEDTLDYYNESISINAVGSLLDNTDLGQDEMAATDSDEFKEERIKETFVRGFEREDKEEAREYLYNKKIDYTKNSNLNRQKREVKYPEGYEPPSRRTNANNRANYKVFSEDYAFNYDVDDINENKISSLKIISIVTFFIFLSILFFLVYRVNTVTRQLEYIQAVEVSTLHPNIDIENLIEQRDELVEQIAALEATVTDLQLQVEGFNDFNQGNNEQNISNENINQETSNTTSINQPSFSNTINGSRTHVVQQGDNLSSISEQFYGTRYDYQRIVDANNLQTDFLNIGQELIIP